MTLSASTQNKREKERVREKSKHRIKLTLFKHSRSRVKTSKSGLWYHLIYIDDWMLSSSISTTGSFPVYFERFISSSISTAHSQYKLLKIDNFPIGSSISTTIPCARRWLIRNLWTTTSTSSPSACHENVSIGSWPSSRLFRQLDHKIFYIDDFPSARQNHQMVLQLIDIEDRFINLTAKIGGDFFFFLRIISILTQLLLYIDDIVHYHVYIEVWPFNSSILTFVQPIWFFRHQLVLQLVDPTD